MIDLKALKENCSNCHLKEICLPSSMSVEEVERLDEIVQKRLKVKKKDTLFKLNQDFEGIYAIKSGSFKTFISDDSGNEQITGFYIQGEIIGLDGFASDRHLTSAVALEDSYLCVLKKEQIEDIANDFSPLQKQLQKILSREIVRENHLMLLLGNMNADQKVAAFLSNLSNRQKEIRQSHDELNLKMTREDIACYLGIKNETVSRVMKRLSDSKVISIDNKNIKILNHQQLVEIIKEGECLSCVSNNDL